MQFPKATSGSGKIFAGEILQLIAAIALGIGSMLVLFASATATSAQDVANTLGEGDVEGLTEAIAGVTTAYNSALGGGAIILVGGIVALVGIILTMVGCGQAGGDEQSFKIALYIMIVMIVLNVVSSFIVVQGSVVATIVTAVNKFLSLYATFMVIQGFQNLANALGNTEMIQKGKSAFTTICVLIIAAVVLSVIATFVGGTIGGILVLVSLVLDVAWYIIYIGFIGKSKNMLIAAN